MQFGDDVERNL